MPITVHIGTVHIDLLQVERDDDLMATLQDVISLVSGIAETAGEIAEALAGIGADVAALKEQIAAGSPISQEQLDSLAAALSDVAVELADVASTAQDLDQSTP